MSSKVVVTPGISVVGLLGVLFVALKLIGTITWPWIWVLAPFWAGIAIILGILAVGLGILVIGLIITLIKFLVDKKRRK